MLRKHDDVGSNEVYASALVMNGRALRDFCESAIVVLVSKKCSTHWATPTYDRGRSRFTGQQVTKRADYELRH